MIEPIVKRVGGIDVHKGIVVVTVLKEDDEGGIGKETKEYRTYWKELREMAGWLKKEDVELVVMESTGVYWKCVYEAIEEEGIRVYVVNAQHVKKVPGRKTDVKDSEWLAELGRCGLLKASFIPPKDIRELRLLTRYRRKLVGYLGGEKNRLQKVLEDGGIKLGCVISDIDGVSARKIIEGIIEKKSPDEIKGLCSLRIRNRWGEIEEALEGYISDRHRFILKRVMGHIKWLEEEIKQIDVQVVKAMEPYMKEWELLQTIPGIDELSAAMLIAEIGVDMGKFGGKEKLSSWTGISPGNNESAGKKKSGRVCKGNKYVKQLLCEIANSAIKTESQFRGYYKGLVIRRGHKKSIIAVGHKILEVIYVILKNKEPYRDPSINYEEIVVKRNAPRWIASLRRFGYIRERVE